MMLIAPSTLAANKHALLIAIQDYAPFESLKGPINDLKLTKEVLRERFGFKNADFITLLNAEATHTGIENAFKQLTKRVQPHDFVYIFYSGHGSQTTDLNGDENSGKDQTWVSYGARTSTNNQDPNNFDVLDDEINAWLSALSAKTDKVVFVSDSCHSATVARGPSAPLRAIKEDKRPHLLGKQNYARPTTYQGIRIGAARDNQSAIEMAQDNGEYYGLFTWHWIQNLQQARANDTWYEVFKRTDAQVSAARYDRQQPYLEGNRHQRLSGDGFTQLPATISVKRIADEWIKIKAGSLAGATKGSVYRLYNPPNPQNLPRLTLTVVKPFASYGVPEPIEGFQTGDLVVEESHVYHFPPVKVSLEADFPADKRLLQMIKSAFPLSAHTLTDDPSQSALRLYLLRPKKGHADDTLPKSFANQAPELWILTPEQRLLVRIPFDNPPKGIERLQENLQKIARVRELKALKSARGTSLPISVQISLVKQVSHCPTKTNCVQTLDGLLYYPEAGPYALSEFDGRTLRLGDLLGITLHNTTEIDYYCYLIGMSLDNAIYVIFPSPEEDAPIRAGTERILTKEFVLEMGAIGKETIKVMTSAKPIDVLLLEQAKCRNSLNPLERLLSYGWRQQTAARVDEWAAGQVTFEVKTKE